MYDKLLKPRQSFRIILYFGCPVFLPVAWDPVISLLIFPYWTAWTLKREAIGCPETSVIKYQFRRSYSHASKYISIVKPTRCINVSNLFYFVMTLYLFRTVFPSIIRSSRLYIKQPNKYRCLFAGWYPLASRQQYLFYICLLLYVQSSTPDDERKDRPKLVECDSKIK